MPTIAARRPGLDAPVYCHPDDVADAESDASIAPYMDLSQLPVAPVRWIYPFLLRRWDGGAVKIAGTVSEGDEVAGFRVIHFPGHAPGLIGLWRESDRRGAGQRRRLLRRLRPAETAARGRGQRPPPRLGLGPRARRRSRCASWRRWNRRSSPPATRSRCAARTCARRSNERPRSTDLRLRRRGGG